MPDGPIEVVRHAFVVDDDPQIRAFVSRAMASVGFHAHEFSRLPEIEGALTLTRPWLIVLDLSLGDADAIEVMRSLAASRFTGRVLLVSGHGRSMLEEVRRIGERNGLAMSAPLTKPFRLAELKERLTEVASSAPDDDGGPLLESALRNSRLELWYQPKVDLATMSVCGAEALVRCRHPTHGLVPPAQFLPPPGDPLYRPLTDFVVRRALADWSMFASAPSIGRSWVGKRLAINVPASILQHPEFVANVRRHLPDHPAFPGLIVEITEDEAIRDPDLAREVAVQLRLYGIHVSIDDFGAGHSSLARLDQLPFAELKLDRVFVDGCSRDRAKRAKCKAAVALARRFGLVVVAEGVETPEDLRALIGMGFDVGQGYLFARPMPAGDFVRHLEGLQAAGID